MIDPGRTGLTGLAAAFGSVAFFCLLLLTPLGPRASMPGPLSSSHAALGDDCGACHVLSDNATQGLLHGLRTTEVDLEQSQQCLTCHEFGEHALAPHNWSAGELAEANGSPGALGMPSGMENGLACATCHQEHRGAEHRISRLANDRCQACHAESFEGFEDHPPFSEYPPRTGSIVFDHVSHVLRHFPQEESNGSSAAPNSCNTCHSVGSGGQRMLLRDYEASCAACHAEDITGQVQAEGLGIDFLTLPALDTYTLEEQGIAIGYWPADSMITETPVTPFVTLLLSADAAHARDLGALEDVDLLDLSEADEETLASVGRLAWGIKQLYGEIASGGHGAVLKRLAVLDGETSSTRMASELLQLFPEDVVRSSLELWLPNLANELEQHAAGVEVATSSTPPEEEPSLEEDERRESWVGTGGWYASELSFAIRYRPGDHADPFLRSWIDLTHPNRAAAPFRELFESLSGDGSVGRCFKCHEAGRGDASKPIEWSSTLGKNDFGRLDRFSHEPHMPSKADNSCAACHDLAEESQASSSFVPMDVATCTQCHMDERGASSDCLTCHAYHSHWADSPAPQAALDALRNR